MQKKEIKQIVSMKMAIYKNLIEENIIDLIFTIYLLSDNVIYYKITKNFDYDLDYQFIFFK